MIQRNPTTSAKHLIGLKAIVFVFAFVLVAGPFYVAATGYAAQPRSNKHSAVFEPSHLNVVPASSPVNPFLYYSSEPAPIGVADYGIGANNNPYKYNTTEFYGIANISSLSTYNASLPLGSRHWMSFQMNVVLNFSYGGTTYAYWIQDVALVNTSDNYISFIDNVWNFSSTAASIYNSTLVGNGTVASSGRTGFYYDWASALPGNNVSLTYPATVQFAVHASTSSKGPEVAFMYNDSHGWQTYDNVLFAFAPNPTANYGFVVDGYNYAPSGNYFDAELILGGPGGGMSTNDTGSQVHLQLEYWNGNNYQLTPSAYNFGSDTAETIGKVISSEYYYNTNGVLFTNVTNGAGTLGQIYNQSTVSFLNVKAVFNFQGSISGTLYVNGTAYPFVGGDINLTMEPGTYNLQLYSGGVLYWQDSAVTLSAGQVLQLNAGYTVTFVESGLPAGESWSITMTNATGAAAKLSSTSTQMTFIIPMDSYHYRVDVVNGYSPTMISDYGYVNHSLTQDVTFVKWSVPMVSTGSFPLFDVYDPSNGYVYVSNNNASTVSVFNGNSIIHVIATGNSPGDMVYDPSNSYIYVVMGSGGIDIINTSSGSVTSILTNYHFGTLTYDTSDSNLYATGSDNITVINPGTNQVVQSIPLSFNSNSIAYDVDNGYLYLTNTNNSGLGGNITALNPQTGGIVSVLAVSYEPIWVMYNAFNDEVYVAGLNINLSSNGYGLDLYYAPGSISVVNGTTVIKTVTAGYFPGVMAFNPSNGQVYVSNLFSDNITVINGSTNNVVRDIGVGYYPIGVAYDPETEVLYVANAYSNNVALVNVVQTYTVMFSETGLPTGTSWSVTLNGATETSTGSSISFTELNGTYAYTVSTPISGGTGVRYVTAGSGSVTVNGNSPSVSVPYTTQYYITMSSSPSAGGTASPLSGWYNVSSTVTLSATPVSGYAFISWTGTGTGSYTGTSASHTITMGAPVTEIANFGKLYAITFTESGLPSGTEWFVNLSNGQSFHSTTSTITFNEPNGTYAYSVSNTSYYYTSSHSGIITVSGAAQSESIAYQHYSYITGTVTPSSAVITINGNPVTVTNGNFNVTVTAGTYALAASSSGYITYYSNFTLSAGQTHTLTITLHIRSSVSTSPSKSPSSSTYLYIGIGAAAVIALIAAAVIVSRKRKQT